MNDTFANIAISMQFARFFLESLTIFCFLSIFAKIIHYDYG